MRCSALAVVVLTVIFPVACFADGLTIVPTTTLAAQTSNNTSAWNGFRSQSTGNLGGANVSKEDVHSLLYPGARTKIFAHLVLWFGQPDHLSVGYSSTDPAQIKRQINDMISRGIDGVIMVWYGPNNSIDRAAQLVMNEAEEHPGFMFALMVDHGAILWDSCAGCTPQQALIQQLQYVERTYFSSPAYLRVNGQPVVTNFDIDRNYQIDWNGVSAALATRPAFLFQNGSGFSHTLSDGAYSWVMPTTTDSGMDYLTSFYQTGSAFSAEQTWGATYKGFNDTLASWGSDRIMEQGCGQTWLQTFSQINSLYSSENQLPSLQLVTWNDYEEGTEIESGIDNCVSLSAAMAGNSLQWNVSGNENTINNYTVYVSTDGQNLMPLGDQAVGSRSLDMCSYALPTGGEYTLYVQAIGKPTLRNQISGAAPYVPHCDATTSPASSSASNSVSSSVSSSTSSSASSSTPLSAPGPVLSPTIALRARPSSITITSGRSGGLSITVAPRSGSFTRPVLLSCSHLPPGASCAFSPATVIPGASGATSLLSISIAEPVSRAHGHPPGGRFSLAVFFLGFPLVGIALLGGIGRKRIREGMVLSAVIGTVILLGSCGALTTPHVDTSAHTYTILITGASGSTKASVPVTLAVP